MAIKREIKDFKFTVDRIDEEKGTFAGYASVWGVTDAYNDVVAKGAFKKTVKEKKAFPLLWSHNPAEPIGIIVPEEDEVGLKVQGSLNLDVQRGRETRSLMRQMAEAGTPMGLSIGYNAVKEKYDKDTGIRTLTEIRLWEISPVVFPACEPARVDDVKSETDAGAPAPGESALPGPEPAPAATSGGQKPQDKGEEPLLRALDQLRASYERARANLTRSEN